VSLVCNVYLFICCPSLLCLHKKTKNKCNLNLFPYSAISALMQHLCISRDLRLIFPIGWTRPDQMTRAGSIIMMRMHL